MSVRDVVVVGGSTAGASAMRELRRQGFDGSLTLLDPEAGTNRPPLSKGVLTKGDGVDSVVMDHTTLEVNHVRSPATSLDPARRVVHAEDGTEHLYDALVVATGSRARRLASPDQRGELVLRTATDAARLRERLATSATAIVVGAGFLGMEVATAAARAGVTVHVVDPDPPLRRLLGDHLATLLVARAGELGIGFHRSAATLLSNPVAGVRLDDGTVLSADVVVSCVGDLPNTTWLAGTGLDSVGGVPIDATTRTGLPGVHAVGDVAAVRRGGEVVRHPFWANATAQGRVAGAAIMGVETDASVVDHYFWTEIAGLRVKVVGPLPLTGPPEVLEDSGADTGILAWPGPTVVALGVNRSLPKLRALARELDSMPP